MTYKKSFMGGVIHSLIPQGDVIKIRRFDIIEALYVQYLGQGMHEVQTCEPEIRFLNGTNKYVVRDLEVSKKEVGRNVRVYL